MKYSLKALLCAALTGLLCVAAGAADAPAAPIKAAFVYVGPVGDGGWSYQHNLGRLALEKALGPKVKTTYVENVAEGADAERVIRKLAASGNSLIFTTSFGFMEPTLKVAKQFPKVHFEHATGYKTAPNMSAYEVRFYEGSYLLGLLAGKMTKTNTLGFIGSHPDPRGDPQYQCLHARCAQRESEDADQGHLGEHLVRPGQGAPGRRDADRARRGRPESEHRFARRRAGRAGERQVRVRLGLRQSKYGPKAHLTANTEDWSLYYIQVVKEALAGKPVGNRKTRWGIKEGAVVLTPLSPAVPADVAKLFEEKKTSHRATARWCRSPGRSRTTPAPSKSLPARQ